MTHQKTTTAHRRRPKLWNILATALGIVLVLSTGSGAQADSDKAHQGYVFSTTSSGQYVENYWSWPSYFRQDSGGRGGIVAVYAPRAGQNRSNVLFQAEWHPKGSQLKLYDLKADGDAFYVVVKDLDNPYASWGPYRVASGDRSAVKNVPIPDGRRVSLRIWDRMQGEYPRDLVSVTTGYRS